MCRSLSGAVEFCSADVSVPARRSRCFGTSVQASRSTVGHHEVQSLAGAGPGAERPNRPKVEARTRFSAVDLRSRDARTVSDGETRRFLYRMADHTFDLQVRAERQAMRREGDSAHRMRAFERSLGFRSGTNVGLLRDVNRFVRRADGLIPWQTLSVALVTRRRKGRFYGVV